MRPMNRLNERGFSLLELVVSAAVMGVLIVAIYTFFVQVRDVNRFASNLVIANQVLQQQLETYRNTPYNNLTTGTQSVSSILSPYPSLRSPRSATAVITELQVNGLKQIDLTISYTDNGGTKTIAATTLVAARGINK
jgi:prepilin-type N-terminal cleavage/methylation domain-containing protein